ncbi:MAG: thiol reductant ABC exporter subunit CydC [Solirubrobacteraceae bacterium]
MRALLATVRPLQRERSRLALAVALAAGATGAAIGLLSTSGYLISRAAQRPMIISLMVAITAVRAFGIARAALRYAERLASHDLALRQLARLRSRLFASLAPLVPGQLRGRGRGDLLTRFVADVDTLQDAHLRVLIPVLVAAAVMGGTGAAGWLMLGAAGAVILGALGVTALLTTWTSAAVAASSARRQAAGRAQLTAELVEAIDGATELALAGRGPERVAMLAAADATLARQARRDAVASSLATALHTLLTGAGTLCVLVVGIDGVRAGELPAVLLAAVVFLFLGAGEALLPLPTAARRLRACTAAAARLEEVCSTRPAITDPATPAALSGGGALALEDVSLRYEATAATVLDRVTLRLEPGERIALLGASGAGKTTIAELLVRFLDPLAGRVTLDGVDLRQLRLDDVRGAVLLCDQDAHLFNTTIRENLLIARRSASEAELWDALATVELDGWIASLQHGLDTRVGQQGELVSGGQRRRLALARALLSEARFLILDEPVAHLDAPLARRVMRRMLEHDGDRAMLVITHAADALEAFDRVLVLERGRLRPLGGHATGGAGKGDAPIAAVA